MLVLQALVLVRVRVGCIVCLKLAGNVAERALPCWSRGREQGIAVVVVAVRRWRRLEHRRDATQRA